MIFGKTIYKQPLKCVEFKSDGVLTSQWVKPFLTGLLRKGIDIMDIDIFAIKLNIETCFQVKKVIVERRFPETLQITVNERIPILRLSIQDSQLSTHEMMVDAEGVVFYGEGISELDHRSMPFLSGITLRKTEKGCYEKISNLDKVYQLLCVAKTKYWPIYTQMEVISIENLKQKNVPWSTIKVRCQCASLIIFKDHDFDEQLKRLDFILNLPAVRDNLPLKRIDLSLGIDVAVKF